MSREGSLSTCQKHYLRRKARALPSREVPDLRSKFGALAQLGERLICIQEVRSSILLGSTNLPFAGHRAAMSREGPAGSGPVRTLTPSSKSPVEDMIFEPTRVGSDVLSIFGSRDEIYIV